MTIIKGCPKPYLNCVLFLVFSSLISHVILIVDGAFLPSSCNQVVNSLTLMQAQQLGRFEKIEVSENAISSRKVKLYNITSELTPYQSAWDLQKQIMSPMLEENLLAMRTRDRVNTSSMINHNQIPGALIYLQHSPVYTLGTRSDLKFVKVDLSEKGIDLVQIERGGEGKITHYFYCVFHFRYITLTSVYILRSFQVTYHGPGQLVAYPLLNLKRDYKADIHWYMRALEEVVILALAKAGIPDAYREEGLTGVFVRGNKVAAFGVKVKRWITMHGLAVNVEKESVGENTFENIIPCGVEDKGVGYLNQFISNDITIAQFSILLTEAFTEIFRVNVEANDSDFFIKIK